MEVVGVHADRIVTTQHDADVPNLYALGALEVDTVAVKGGIVANTLESHMFTHTVGIVLAFEIDVNTILQTINLLFSDRTDDTNDEWRLILTFSISLKNIGKTRLFYLTLSIVNVTGDGVDVLSGNI